MSIISEIIQFAASSKSFSRKELIDSLHNQLPTVLQKTVSQQLGRLVKSKRLVRLRRGVYALSETSQQPFIPVVSDKLKQLNEQIKTQFPFVSYCLWSSNILFPYMHHIPNLNFIYMDVESDAAESVFNFLNNNDTERIFLRPNATDFNRYIAGTESIIIRSLVSESPLQIIEKIPTPTIEKILVDVVGDVEFEFLQGAEVTYFYHNVIERHNINKNKLLRYASRRGRSNEVEQLYNNAL
jgi:predicted transcriptional regulator of viral defense system